MFLETEDELSRAHDELEQRVRERTAKLLETNKTLESMITAKEDAIQRLNRMFAVLSVTNHAIVRTNDRHTLFSNICRGAVEHGGFKLVWIGLIADESGTVRPVSWYGDNGGFLDEIQVSALEVPEGMGPTGSAIRDGQYHICNDFIHDSRTLLWHEKGRERSFHSAASIALAVNKKVVGALTIYSDEPNYFCSQMSELLKQMAMDISFALDNLERTARHQDTERALYAETTERLRLLEALHSKEQQFMQQSRHAAMGEMIGNIAHQWRQPLNALALKIQCMELTHPESASFKNDRANDIRVSMGLIEHMSRTITDFTSFFRPDKQKSTFNVSMEISKTLTLIEAVFNEERINIEVAQTGAPLIYGYPNEYSHGLLNILINAKDAFSNGKAKCPTVTIRLFTEEGKSVVTITDNAGGIPEDIMDKIFDPYFTTKDSDKGTGVGLFMSKIIIEKNMGGTLGVRNTGSGAEFRIEV